MYRPPTAKKDQLHAHRGPSGTCLRKQGKKYPPQWEIQSAIDQTKELMDAENVLLMKYNALNTTFIAFPEARKLFVKHAFDEQQHFEHLRNLILDLERELEESES